MSESRIYDLVRLFNLKVVGCSIALAIGLSVCTLSTFWATRQELSPEQQATAVMNLIKAPTPTQPLPTASPTTSLTPTAGIPPPPPLGAIAIDDYVQVTGTGGDGLRFRQEPGLGAQIMFLGAEAEIFKVADGPREVDGFTWWYLVGPYDENRAGWVVSNYLVVVQNP